MTLGLSALTLEWVLHHVLKFYPAVGTEVFTCHCQIIPGSCQRPVDVIPKNAVVFFSDENFHVSACINKQKCDHWLATNLRDFTKVLYISMK